MVHYRRNISYKNNLRKTTKFTHYTLRHVIPVSVFIHECVHGYMVIYADTHEYQGNAGQCRAIPGQYQGNAGQYRAIPGLGRIT